VTESSARRVTIFYSWQGDRDRDCCKEFIRLAADAAAAKLSGRLSLEVIVDADTEGVAGTPAINDTILRKIEESDLFLADMTFVAQTQAGKRVPNPNVMGEYGYALKCKGLQRILLAMNTAFGSPEELPFDLRHLRHPAQYALEEGAPDGERRRMRGEFAAKLERNLSVAIERLLRSSTTETAALPWDDAEAALTNIYNSHFAGLSPLLVSAPKLLVHVVPLRALDQPPLPPAIVKSARSYFLPSVDDQAREGVDETQWWSGGPLRPIPGKPNPEAGWSFRLVRPGVFEVASTIGRRIDDDPEIVVHGQFIEVCLVEAVDRVRGGGFCGVGSSVPISFLNSKANWRSLLRTVSTIPTTA
jgi:hypothetical protein